MELYSGSPLSFAACYGLEGAVQYMMQEDGCDPNLPEWKCEWTGFLPLHAVVATNNMRMYSFMTNKDLFLARTAKWLMLTQIGKGGKWKSPMLPVQIACRRGDRA
eukprot:7385231-Prymnesium_polylepis.2